MEPQTPALERVTSAHLSEGTWSERFAALARVTADEPVPAELHPALVGLLAAPEADQRAGAVAVAARAGAPIVPLLLAVLADEASEPDAQRAAVVALGRLGPSAHAAAWVLLDLVDDPRLGSCARAALDAVEPPQRGGFQLLCVVVAIAALVAMALTAP